MRAAHATLFALIAAATVAACAPAHDEHVARIAELEDTNARLTRENEALRLRYEGPPATPAPPIETRCAKKGAGWKITPSGLDELLKNSSGVRQETRPRVYFEGGKYSGMRINAPPGSLAASCGCEDGDVIQKVNGIPLVPAKNDEIEASLRKASRVELEIQRAGSAKTIAVDVAQ